MKNILFISIISLLFFSACEKHSLEINDNNPAFNLPKFPEEIINVNTHNYMPEMAIEKWENGNIKPFGQNNLSRATEILKDSLWKNDFGRTIYAQADESIILPNLQRYIPYHPHQDHYQLPLALNYQLMILQTLDLSSVQIKILRFVRLHRV